MDRYTIVERIGDGSQGVAYVATVNGSIPPQKVVLKKMPAGIRSSEEISVALRIHHANIVETIEAFDHEDFTYLVMRHAEGGDLDSYLARRASNNEGPPPTSVLVSWMYQLCRALQHCHDNRIMHRDIKPSNIFLNADATQLLLGDFGTAKAFSGSVAVANTFVGSPVWVSPEVLSGTPYSFMSDVWSLGCVFYEMIALRKAFGAPHFAALVTKICSGAYDPLPPKTPTFLVNVIAGMLNVDANERWLLSDVLNSHEQFQLAAVTLRKSKKQGSSNTQATVENRVKPDPGPVLAPLDDWVKSKQRDLLRIESYLRPFRDSDAMVLKTIAQRTPRDRPEGNAKMLDIPPMVQQDVALKANRAKRMLASPAHKDGNSKDSGRSSTPQGDVSREISMQRRSLSEELQMVSKRPGDGPQKIPAPPPEAPKDVVKDLAVKEREQLEAKRVQSRMDMKAMIREARARKSEGSGVPVEIMLPANLQGLAQNKV
jgi:serine/threonine protein kinase